MNVSLKQILKDYENLLIDIMSANKNNGYYKTTFNAEGISNAYGRLQSYVETTSQGSEKQGNHEEREQKKKNCEGEEL